MARATINVGVNTASANNRLNQLGSNANSVNSRMATGTAQVADLYDRLSQSAQNLIRDMIQANSTRGPEEMVRSIEKQIRAQERLNRLRKDVDLAEARQDRDSGAITQDEFRSRVSNINEGAREGGIESQILREILEAIRDDAREQVISDRQGVEKSLSNSRLDQLREGDNEEEILRRAYQRTMIGDGGDGGGPVIVDREEEDKNRRSAVNEGLNAISNENELYAMASLAGMIPVIGAGLSSFLTKAFKDAEEYQIARGDVRELGNQKFSPDGYGRQFGLSKTDYMNEFADPAIRASGRFDAGQQSAKDAALLSNTVGVDTGTIMETIKNLRTSDTKDLVGFVGNLQASLEATGEVMADDFSKLNEYMEVNNSLLASQLMRLDSIDAETNLKLLAGIVSMGGSLADPRVAASVQSSLDKGLRTPSSDYVEAIQYQVLARNNPQMSAFEFEKQREEGVQNPEYLKGLIDFVVKQNPGSKDLQKFALKSIATNLSFAQSESIIEGIDDGKEILPELDKRGDFRKKTEARISDTAGSVVRSTAGITDEFAVGGDRMVAELKNILGDAGMAGAINGVFTLLNGGIKLTGSALEEIQRMANATVETVKKLDVMIDNMPKWMGGSGGITPANKAPAGN